LKTIIINIVVYIIWLWLVYIYSCSFEYVDDDKDIGSSSELWKHMYAGKNCFMWVGPKPRVFIMDPEQIKDILTKAGRSLSEAAYKSTC